MRRNGSGCASGLFSVVHGGNLPRPAPRRAARAGVCRLVFLGDPSSLDGDGPDPHRCARPQDAVAVPSLAATAARRSQRRPLASCSATMASRSRFRPARPGMPPRSPPLPRSPRQRRPRSRTRKPSRRAPRSIRWSREAPHCRARCPCRRCLPSRRNGASVDPPLPPAMRRHGQSVPAGCISPSDPQRCRVGFAWHPGVGRQAMARRARAGFPPAVCHPVCRASSPDHVATGLQMDADRIAPGTNAAPAPRV